VAILQIIERRAFERRGRPMIDRGLKQIAVAKATPVLDGPLPVFDAPRRIRVARATRGVHVRVRLSPFPAC